MMVPQVLLPDEIISSGEYLYTAEHLYYVRRRMFSVQIFPPGWIDPFSHELCFLLTHLGVQ
jgi:hypothetical protein